MRIFLDTNVIMDYLTSRGDVEIIGKSFDRLIQENTLLSSPLDRITPLSI